MRTDKRAPGIDSCLEVGMKPLSERDENTSITEDSGFNRNPR